MGVTFGASPIAFLRLRFVVSFQYFIAACLGSLGADSGRFPLVGSARS